MTAATLLALVLGALPQPWPTDAPQLVRAYAGVACPTPNAIGCDRLGLAVTVRPRPRRAVALIAGRRVVLRPLGDGRQLAGHLGSAGLRGRLDGHGLAPAARRWAGWVGGAQPPLLVALVLAEYDDGHRAAVPVVTKLCPGWG